MKAKRTVVSNPPSPLAKPSSDTSSLSIKEAIANEAPVVESPQRDEKDMGRYLNRTNNGFASDRKFPFYVDKSLLIKETNACFGIDQMKFMCVTRPRRFGKTMALKMLNAYYAKESDSRELFKDLKISEDPSFEEHLNKHNVLWVDMGSIYTGLKDPNLFVEEIKRRLLGELIRNYPRSRLKGLSLSDAITKLYLKKGERFIFLIDEWDVIYREEERNKKLCDSYTKFLRDLFKSSDVSDCFDLVYMTGILPIRRYFTQSTLNMFTEYNMLSPRELAPLFGFTEAEVKSLCEKHNANFEQIKNWYDGYRLNGLEIYSPKSVVEAIRVGACRKFWTASSAIEAVADYMNFDKGALKAEIMRMLAGDKVELDPDKFSNDLTRVDSKDAALAVLVHLGYLAFIPDSIGAKGACYIPNREIQEEFENALEALDWKDIYDPISNSPKLLQATIDGDVEEINRGLDKNHKDLASPFSKSDEGVLGIVTIVSYYRARSFYEIRKEEVSMKGRSDVSFFPIAPGRKPIIVELKVGKSPDEAIAQIKEKAYWEAWPHYKGKVLLVGITYDSKTLKHASKVEWIDVD